MELNIDWNYFFNQIDSPNLTASQYTELYTLIFKNVSSLRYYNGYSFFKNFIHNFKLWIQKSKNKYVINCGLPWITILKYLPISDWAKMKQVNSVFNQGINIEPLLQKIKFVNNSLIYFSRTYYKRDQKNLLDSIGLVHLYNDKNPITLLDVLIYIAKGE